MANKRKRNHDGGGRSGGNGNNRRRHHSGGSGGGADNANNNHRFGRVMSQPPKLKLQGRTASNSYPTVSIAVPGSFVSNAQTRELQTQLAGQIARAAAVYRVDEIVVFDDGLGSQLKTVSNYRRGAQQQGSHRREVEHGESDVKVQSSIEKNSNKPQLSTDPHAFLARILQYCECPQYLRRKFFPMHPDLQFAGLLPPLDMPHHLRRGDVAAFREGVVVERKEGAGETKEGGEEGGSFVECGVPNRLVQIDRTIPPGIRCTVQLDIKAYESRSQYKPNSKTGITIMKGKVVSPTTPRDTDGIYWGFTTRMASSINAIFKECPYDGGYDLKVGTSERGDVNIDDPRFCLTKKNVKQKKKKPKSKIIGEDADEHFNHLLIVFGGVAGIEESVDADESMTLSGEDSKKMFDVWLNICPFQGSRTIRSEEAVFITLARLSPYITKNGMSSQDSKGKGKSKSVEKTDEVQFSDAVSEESSDEE